MPSVLEIRWEILEKQNISTPKIFKWFQLHVAPIIRKNMNTELLQNLGVGWKSRHVCTHCIAVAEDKQLENFLIWFRTTKSSANLTTAVYCGTYKHAGHKSPPRRKYGDSVHLPLDQKTEFLRVIFQTDAGRLQNEHCYAKIATNISNEHITTGVAGQSVEQAMLVIQHFFSTTTSHTTTSTLLLLQSRLPLQCSGTNSKSEATSLNLMVTL